MGWLFPPWHCPPLLVDPSAVPPTPGTLPRPPPCSMTPPILPLPSFPKLPHAPCFSGFYQPYLTTRGVTFPGLKGVKLVGTCSLQMNRFREKRSFPTHYVFSPLKSLLLFHIQGHPFPLHSCHHMNQLACQRLVAVHSPTLSWIELRLGSNFECGSRLPEKQCISNPPSAVSGSRNHPALCRPCLPGLKPDRWPDQKLEPGRGAGP